MTVDEIHDRYKDRALVILGRIQKALQKKGYDVSGPFDMHDEDFRWYVVVEKDEEKARDPKGHFRAKLPQSVDVSFVMAESELWDGSEGGINFLVDIVADDGRVLGGLAPYNYTEKVWVPRDDETAVEERFQILEQADPEGAVECVEHLLK
jgi:hypothetical protein